MLKPRPLLTMHFCWQVLQTHNRFKSAPKHAHAIEDNVRKHIFRQYSPSNQSRHDHAKLFLPLSHFLYFLIFFGNEKCRSICVMIFFSNPSCRRWHYRFDATSLQNIFAKILRNFCETSAKLLFKTIFKTLQNFFAKHFHIFKTSLRNILTSLSPKIFFAKSFFL